MSQNLVSSKSFVSVITDIYIMHYNMQRQHKLNYWR